MTKMVQETYPKVHRNQSECPPVQEQEQICYNKIQTKHSTTIKINGKAGHTDSILINNKSH